MKKLLVPFFLVFCWSALAQQAPTAIGTPQQTGGRSTAADSPELQPVRLGAPDSPPPATSTGVETPELQPVAALPRPEKFAVAFLALGVEHSNEGVAFLVAPDGRIGTVPIAKLGPALKSGLRPFTVRDLLTIANAIGEEETVLRTRYKELSEDYDSLAARYNRLAEISSAAPVQPQPPVDERQLMRAMLFRSLLQRAIPAQPMQVQVQSVDCSKFPSLCVNH